MGKKNRGTVLKGGLSSLGKLKKEEEKVFGVGCIKSLPRKKDDQLKDGSITTNSGEKTFRNNNNCDNCEKGDIVIFEDKGYADNIRYSYQKPTDTWGAMRVKECDNFSIFMHRLIPTFGKEKSKHLEDFNEYPKSQEKVEKKVREYNKKYFNETKANVENYIETIRQMGRTFKLTLSSRMVIGLGSASVYETSMTLHHIYGIPYIPGQAVKGITRHCFILEKAGDKRGDDLKNMEKELEAGKYEDTAVQKEYTNLFGTQDQAGSIIYFDAFPTGEIKLKTDIMTPHYGDYYSGKEVSNGKKTPPADYLKPNPIPFLTVEETKFQFVVGVKKKCKQEKLHEKAEKYVEKALTEHGIGAKTAVGYGFF